MAHWRDFAATNEDGTCLWCGRTLRYQTRTAVDAMTIDTRHCGEQASPVYRRGPVTQADYHCNVCGQDFEPARVPYHVDAYRAEKPGSYEDGFFCGLRCAYEFAVQLARNGRRLMARQ